MSTGDEPCAEVYWIGNSKEELLEFPRDVVQDLGRALRQLQRCESPDLEIRPMQSIGRGVFELKDYDERKWYRLIYLAVIRQHEPGYQKRRKGFRSAEHMKKAYKTCQVTKGSIFDDRDLFSPGEAAILKAKDSLLTAILAEIRSRRYSQTELVGLLNEYQPNVSNLLRGKISKVSVEKLIAYAARLKLQPKISVTASRPSRRRKTTAAA